MTLSLDPGEITGDVDVRGHAPVRLTAADGRVSQFARAWVSIRHRGRPQRRRLDGMEPQPRATGITAVPDGAAPPIVVMGVSGSGKSTVGSALAQRLRVPFVDADSLHPPANVAKMSAGQPLNDDDRYPWLERVGEWLAGHSDGGVVSCSALKRKYRDQLRTHCPRVEFLHLSGSPEIDPSLGWPPDPDHFMPAALLRSQFDALEPLGADEPGVTVDIGHDVDAIIDTFLITRGACDDES